MAAIRDVKVGWRVKALAFHLFDAMPFGEQVYYLFQRYVTHTQPRKLANTERTSASQVAHIQRIRERKEIGPEAVLLEFGAGWDLYSNLIYYCLGVEKQIAIDIRRWARAETVNAVIDHLRADPPAGSVRVPQHHVRDETLEQDLATLYGIDYRAPFDAAAMDCPTASVDFIITTSVLEHIPEAALAPILKECRRVLKPGGLMSHTVDYSDHYAHADPNIGDYNYLQFSEEEWRMFNPSIHYQNRLRGPAYRSLFSNTGFAIIDEIAWKGSPEELASIVPNPKFADLGRDELHALGCHFLLEPAASSRM